MVKYTGRIPLFLLGCIGVMTITGCKKLTEVGVPKNQIASSGVFLDQAGAEAAIAGMYGGLYSSSNSTSSNIPTYGAGISLLNGLLADELTYNGTTFDQYTTNGLVSNESNVANVWTDSYAAIYRANAIIEGVAVSSFPTAYKNQATGEALFIRAFCHFYLVNLYGDVPLMTTTVVQDNQTASRAAASLVYNQIITDLEQAVTLLTETYPSGSNRTRVNKYAAAALLARVYLYHGDNDKAEAAATQVINAAALYTLPGDLSTVFLTSSTEAIWDFDTSVFGYPFVGAQTVPNAGVIPYFVVMPNLLAAFEVNDKRKASWVNISADYYYPYKYHTKTKVNQEYDVVLRLAEQYLVRAEARAQQKNLTGATEDINVIRKRAGLGNTPAATQGELLAAVAQERRVELFSEWGHRWLDLKRTAKVDSVITALKPGLWETTDALYPVPSAERTKNVNLSQNLGYN
ncbi:RagB/SusD domain-containing protein [Filimonas lacunae]|uniref:RagB/SusD domain-containing protein n=1 Tax=Filimonas lacunae TaxID=477680 RepID=A0A173MH58_9BACT|nr:RagB/SusD family nutrient uptake outer membrane protein [Filimonas lacunae]BAV06954.1 outer membrane protein, nutrient binding [Filimonas lacunae]SIS97278.1 RagB/SusD domain-containing protein [Filimonas lacunae]